MCRYILCSLRRDRLRVVMVMYYNYTSLIGLLTLSPDTHIHCTFCWYSCHSLAVSCGSGLRSGVRIYRNIPLYDIYQVIICNDGLFVCMLEFVTKHWYIISLLFISCKSVPV